MSCLRRGSAALCLLLGVAGCGGGESGGSGAAADARPGPCARKVAAVIAQAAGARPKTRVTAVSPGQATCVYQTPDMRVDVMIDNLPQVQFRFDRAVVERGQNAVWGHDSSKAPRMLHGIGGGADWFPADNQLLAIGRRLLITISIVRPEHGGLALSKRVARATIASSAAPGPGRTLR
jgi:hypothetical protein